ncbi:MAG: FUSC family protein, partial [Paraclostridium sp.]
MKIDTKKIKSTIISKTVIFLFVMAFVIIFRSVFGEENTILGVTTLILTLSLLQRDLTKKPLKTLVNLIVFNLLLGLAAFLVSANLWLGLIANFIAMASIGYIFNYELNNPMNMLFGLHYILLMTSTIQSSQIPMRIVALIIGPCIIMVAQLLANKNKLVKSSKKIIDTIEVNLTTKIKLLKEVKDISEINNELSINISKLKSLIYESGRVEFHLTKYATSVLNILSCIEKINLSIDELSKKDTKLIVILEDIFYDIKENKFISEEVENKALLYGDNSVDLLEIYEVINTCEVLIKEMKTIKELSDEEKNNIDEMVQIPFEFTSKGYHKKSLNINSNRVAYAIRLGLLVSITTFITKYCNLEYGKWMIYTVFALTQPYEEFTKIKSIKRIIGTVIGALIVMVLFNVTKGPTPKMIAMLVSGYLMSYVSDYKYTMILSTICVLSSAGASMSNPNVVVFNRIGFVIIGIVISLLASKLILSKKYEDEEKKLIGLQKDATSRLIKEVIVNDS